MSDKAHDSLPDLIFSRSRKSGKLGFAPSSLFGIHPLLSGADDSPPATSFKVGITYSRPGPFRDQEVQESVQVAHDESQTFDELQEKVPPLDIPEESKWAKENHEQASDESDDDASIPEERTLASLGDVHGVDHGTEVNQNIASSAAHMEAEVVLKDAHKELLLGDRERKPDWSKYIMVDSDKMLDEIRARIVAPPEVEALKRKIEKKLKTSRKEDSSEEEIFEGFFSSTSPRTRRRTPDEEVIRATVRRESDEEDMRAMVGRNSSEEEEMRATVRRKSDEEEMRTTVKEAKRTMKNLKNLVETEKMTADEIKRELARLEEMRSARCCHHSVPSSPAGIAQILSDFERRISQDRRELLKDVRHEVSSSLRPVSPPRVLSPPLPTAHYCACMTDEDWAHRLQVEQDRQWSLLMKARRECSLPLFTGK